MFDLKKYTFSLWRKKTNSWCLLKDLILVNTNRTWEKFTNLKLHLASECNADCALRVQQMLAEQPKCFSIRKGKYLEEYLEIMEDPFWSQCLGREVELLLVFIRRWPGIPNVLK